MTDLRYMIGWNGIYCVADRADLSMAHIGISFPTLEEAKQAFSFLKTWKEVRLVFMKDENREFDVYLLDENEEGLGIRTKQHHHASLKNFLNLVGATDDYFITYYFSADGKEYFNDFGVANEFIVVHGYRYFQKSELRINPFASVPMY